MVNMKGALERLPDEMREGKIVLSPSALMEFAESPDHYYSKYVLGLGKPSKAQEEGTLVHLAVLEPEKFMHNYALEPSIEDYPHALKSADDMKAILEKHGLPKSGSKDELKKRICSIDGMNYVFWDDIVTDTLKGKIGLSKDEWQMCEAIKTKVHNHEFLGKHLKNALFEQKAWWLHERTGVYISMRMDAIKEFSDGTGMVVDVKKMRSAKPTKFASELWYSNLFIQAAMYLDGMTQITDKKYEHFVWAVVTPQAPYTVMAYAADFGMLEAGRAHYNKLIDDFISCHEQNRWPSYSNNLMNISLPHWAWGQLEEWNDNQLGDTYE